MSYHMCLLTTFRFSSHVSKKLDKERKRRTSTSYVPDKELGVYNSMLHRTESPEEIPENITTEHKPPKVWKVTIRVTDL